jgi:hypothetical protein
MTAIESALLTRQVRELLGHILGQLDFPGVDKLLQQVSRAYIVSGPVTMLEIGVVQPAPASAFLDGPVPMSAAVVGASGNSMGELLIWLKNGYLDAFEFAWWTDEPPDRLPSVEHVRVLRR